MGCRPHRLSKCGRPREAAQANRAITRLEAQALTTFARMQIGVIAAMRAFAPAVMFLRALTNLTILFAGIGVGIGLLFLFVFS